MRTHFIAIGGARMIIQHWHYTVKDITLQVVMMQFLNHQKQDYKPKDYCPKKWDWFPDKITSNIEAIILGMHAKPDNPELLKAQELGLKIYSYPSFYMSNQKIKNRVVIGGLHGKTTITSMILHVLNYHNIKVDYMVGAQLIGI